MEKRSSKIDFWLTLVAVIAVAIGGVLFLGFQLNIPPEIKKIMANPITYQSLGAILLSLIVWTATRYYTRRRFTRLQKEFAKKTVRKTFDLLRITSRTLDNIDLKAGAILTGGTSPALDRALAHEFMQNVRNQVVEIYNNVTICIEDWHDVLDEEFSEIEKRERQLERINIEQANKARKLKEFERRRDGREKEIKTLKADLARLAEKKRIYQANLLSEAKRLVGAPITKTTDFANLAPSNASFEHLLKPPLYLNEVEVDEIS